MNVLKLKNLLDNYTDLGIENWILLRELMKSSQGFKIQLKTNNEKSQTNIIKHASGIEVSKSMTTPFSWIIGDGVTFQESKASILDITDRGDQSRLSIGKPILLNYGITYQIVINNVVYYKDKDKSFKDVFGHSFDILNDSVIIIKEIDWNDKQVEDFEKTFGLDSSENEFHKIESSLNHVFNLFHPQINVLDFLSSLIKNKPQILSLKDISNDIGFLSVLREYINELVFAPSSLKYIEERFANRQKKEELFNQELRTQLKIEI